VARNQQKGGRDDGNWHQGLVTQARISDLIVELEEVKGMIESGIRAW
jgi:hypothetical protein